MRIRRKPWARPELEACPYYIPDAPALIGRWAQRFPNHTAPIHLELGCGKGRFVGPASAANPELNYLAVDIKSEMLAYTRRHVEECFAAAKRGTVDNVLLTSFDIARLSLMLGEGDEVARVYINFPNPWPKEPHKKRRLTHTRQLVQYRDILAPGGELHFKTDDRPLFDETLLYLEEAGYVVLEQTTDLYHDGVPDGALLTEHEELFTREGKPICRLVARVRVE